MGCFAVKALRSRAGRLHPALSAVLLIAAAGPAVLSAQDEPDAGRYEVEVIVFENLEDAPGEPRAEVAPQTGRGPDEAADDDSETTQPRGPAQVRPLAAMDSAGRELDEVWSRLEEAESYRPLIHRVWLQTATDADSTPAVRLRSDATLQPLPANIRGPVYRVDGTVELTERRYLHLRANLTLSEVGEGRSAGAGGERGALWRPFGADRTITRYRLSQSRRIDAATLSYFDHPRFGLLVEVRPADTEADDS